MKLRPEAIFKNRMAQQFCEGRGTVRSIRVFFPD
jgi:hypothetical protein